MAYEGYYEIMKDIFPLFLPITISGTDALSLPDQLKQCTTELSLCYT